MAVYRKEKTAQHGVHLTLGIGTILQAFSYASAFFSANGVPPSAPSAGNASR